jgi:hypothetical protein
MKIDEIVKRYHNPCVQIDHSKWSTGEAVTDVMYEHETGQWVKYSDYAALIAKVRELEKDKAGLVAIMEDITGEAAFEGLPETKQAAISEAIKQHGGEQ